MSSYGMAALRALGRRKSLVKMEAKDWQTTVPVPAQKSENYIIEKMTLPPFTPLDLNERKMICFEEPVTFTVLKQNKSWGEVIMSDTPMEQKSNANAVRLAKGHVLVAGLGIGYTLMKICAKKSVKSVTVVELSQEVIDLVWPHIEPHCHGKVKLITKSIFDYKTTKKFDFAWFDIWNSTGGYERDMPKLKKQFAKNLEEKQMLFWGTWFN